MERPRFSDHLEAIKFICKDFWSEVFKKQIDNLKTNHRVRFSSKKKLELPAQNEKTHLVCFLTNVSSGYFCIARQQVPMAVTCFNRPFI